MAAPQNFRTAFNGFHKEDVVRYLEYINSKHTAEVNQLTSEADFLRDKLEALETFPAPETDMSDTVSALEQERDDLRTQLEELQARYDALEQELAAKAQEDVPAAESRCGVREELEAYRRAERTERVARERAAQLYRQTTGVLTDATAKVDTVAAEIGGMADQVMAQLEQLQDAVTNSKHALQDAADIMNTLRPENL